MSSEPLLIFETKARGLGRKDLQAFARRLRDEVAGGRSFCGLITNDAELHRLNLQFLGHDYPTDVLSFPSPAPAALGDLAISVERAAEQAARHGHDTPAEIRILLLHGVLHLMGYDHETDKGRMRRAEKRWRQALGLPSGLIERAAR
jgi:probable rRNA maturation factor